VPAPDGDVPGALVREMERAKKDGRTLLVYAGATWCEPCQRFHRAADAGEIQGGLPPLRMLEFDLDRDGDRLAAAGYGSKMIPLFAVPGPDGRGTAARIEGSIKGAGAVGNIVPRLSALLAKSGAAP
jgi:thiol-disulfide isomerase/thioredoxin